ncbi:26S proteasome non-ATPase regulatory subunit 1 [Hondaea fermentalgiana]|uniref:26S proteasome non-ATPase regulatory subunit 1 n=1 Tax=Hondaea fermentalgiana TaxID=2315210 RepID=A0A2R5G121_9STRA|nr:26S proteasome non-ATPase regulatory subunit 1 [Hondaea fermentalgiana]|eukprot:GBG24717.1 26S proteasome non-ATPase regulatory subunit 1 [Hondaea fermentalgiana]
MNSVTGLLGLLDEEDEKLQAYALEKLLSVLDEHWAEVADTLDTIEALSEDESFPHQELAAFVSSKCFYHLEEYDDALRLALSAGDLFDVGSAGEYEVTIVGKCIEQYIALRSEEAEVDPKLERIVEGMFEKCYSLGNFRQALGIALEANRLDKVEDALVRSGDELPEMLSHCMQVCQRHVSSRSFRREVFSTLVRLYEEQRDSCKYIELATCLHYLGEVAKYASLIMKLIEQDDDEYLTAYQAVFDLMELQDQRFVGELLAALPKPEGSKSSADLPDGDERRLLTVREILGEGISTAMYLDFLYKNNKTDALGLRLLKQSVEQGRKNSVLHNATIVAHSYLQAGTTVDSFVRNNLEWLGRATNWAKFTATASLGVIHKGNVKPSMDLLQPYLPSDLGTGASQSPYSEGGALYALGLIHAGEGATNENGSSALEYLTTALDGAGNQENETAREALQHGACLGVGLVAMASGDAGLAEKLQNVVYNDNAVAGEGAALAMGMVMLGGGSKHADVVADILGYAHDTQHEKIIRGLGLAVAMVMYGQEEAADALIEQLCRDKDPILRYGGMYTVGLAYAGTANNAAIRRLLHVAVSDVADDVRRAAVTSLGFVMLNVPERIPELIALLSESYNPHVRYGACMALAIGCSHMDDPTEALNLLDHLKDDKVDFVKQGALLACAMLLMQQNPETNNKAKILRHKLSQTIGDAKHSPTMTRMGAILATGLIDAGGRNVKVELKSRTGFTKPPAVVGMVLWTQYWYWYPMLHMISLTLTPTALIGVNWQLDMPTNFEVDCYEDLKFFDYPKPMQEKKEKKQVRVKTAVLSMTAKAKAREALKRKDTGLDAMEEDEDDDTKKKTKSKKSNSPEHEAPVTKLTNPLRVTAQQSKYIRFKTDDRQRYVPVYPMDHPMGIFVLRDRQPGEDEDVMKVAVPPTGAAMGADDDEDSAEPPAPFEWTEPSHRN